MKRRLSLSLVLCLGTALGCGDDTGPGVPATPDAGDDAGGNTSSGNTSSSNTNTSKSSSSDGSRSDGGGGTSQGDAGDGGDAGPSVESDASADGGDGGGIVWGDAATFSITSPNFDDGEPLPNQYTCEGEPFGAGYSPELNWSGLPAGTKRLAIAFKDTTIEEAGGEFQGRAYHWVAWDIPVTVSGIPQHLSAGDEPQELQGGKQFRGGPPHDNEFFGPCPSWRANACPGESRVTDSYAFVLYAFDDDDLEYPADAGVYDARALHDFFEANASAKTTLTATSNAQPSSSFECPLVGDGGADAGDAATESDGAVADASADAGEAG